MDSVVKSKLLFIHQIICNPSIESMIQLLSEMHFLVSGILLMINLKHPTIFSWESFVVLSVFINLEGLFVCSKRTKIWQLWGGRELCGLLLFPPFLLPLDTRGTQEWHEGLEAQMDSDVQLSPAGCESKVLGLLFWGQQGPFLFVEWSQGARVCWRTELLGFRWGCLSVEGLNLINLMHSVSCCAA